MASQAPVVPSQGRFGEEALVEPVKHDALTGILRCDFDESAANPADDDGVIEKERTRIALRDSAGLDAVLYEERDLRRDWDVQRCQQRFQISGRALGTKHDLAILNLPVELGYWIPGRLYRVLDRTMIDPICERAAERVVLGFLNAACIEPAKEAAAIRRMTTSLVTLCLSISTRAVCLEFSDYARGIRRPRLPTPNAIEALHPVADFLL